jgi:glycosyltransferase involved in cell wall biosynthesis
MISRSARAIRFVLRNCINSLLSVPRSEIRVHHGGGAGSVGGPAVKLWRMQKYFPDRPYRYNLVYSVSAKVPPVVCRHAKKRGINIVSHVNSIFHAAYRPNFEQMNRPIAEVYKMADHVVFGSEHARSAALQLLGESSAPSSTVYNAVDVNHFTPTEKPDGRLNVLVIGIQTFRHVLESVIRAMPFVIKVRPEARLIVAGQLSEGHGISDCALSTFRRIASEVGLNRIEFLGRYSQQDAPKLYGLGDVQVHMKHMDWTPNTVTEGMSCGLPILHTGNGGVGEIVGDAGLSLALPPDWECIQTPGAELLASSILQLSEVAAEKGRLARRRAEQLFSMETWVETHKKLFTQLLTLE